MRTCERVIVVDGYGYNTIAMGAQNIRNGFGTPRAVVAVDTRKFLYDHTPVHICRQVVIDKRGIDQRNCVVKTDVRTYFCAGRQCGKGKPQEYRYDSAHHQNVELMVKRTPEKAGSNRQMPPVQTIPSTCFT